MSASILAKTFVRVGSRRGVGVEVHLTLLPATAIFGLGSASSQIVGAAIVLALVVATLAELRAARSGVVLRLTPLGLGQDGGSVAQRGAAARAGARAYFWLAIAWLIAWALTRSLRPELSSAALLAAGASGFLLVLALLPSELLGGRWLWQASLARHLAIQRTHAVPPPDALLRAAEEPLDSPERTAASRDHTAESFGSAAPTWAVEEAERIARAELARLRDEQQTERAKRG